MNRRMRWGKTDRIDAKKLLAMLIRYHGGEPGMWSMVNVPSVEAEDSRHFHRALDVLSKLDGKALNSVSQRLSMLHFPNLGCRLQLSIRLYKIKGRIQYLVSIPLLFDQRIVFRIQSRILPGTNLIFLGAAIQTAHPPRQNKTPEVIKANR